MKISRNEGLGMAAIAIIGFLGYKLFKSNQALTDKEQKYNVNLEEVKADITEEVRNGIHDEVVDNAITQAVAVKVDAILREGTSDAIKAAKDIYHKEISSTVYTTWFGLKQDVEKDLLEQVGHIDVDEIRREAIEKARDKAVSEASSSVDKVVDDIRSKYDKRADEAVKSAERRFEKKVDKALSDLKDRYQSRVWDELWRV